MYSYLKGQAIAVQQTAQNRYILVLEVNHIGYELQITKRFSQNIQLNVTEIIQIFTHLQQREDQTYFYGFVSIAERDLFRQLTSVSGIGSQLAIALLDTFTPTDLIQSVLSNDHKRLSQTPGVGKKTAERIALELRSKLSQWRDISGISLPSQDHLPNSEILEDLEMTLLALGYSHHEITQAIAVLSQDQQLLENPKADEWIRQAIAHLSRQ